MAQTFDDLKLLWAVSSAYASTNNAGSDEWLVANRDQLASLVLSELAPLIAADQSVPWTMNDIRSTWLTYRKNPKMKLLADVSRAMGGRCFYEDRGLGPCSPDVQLDRVIPGGPYERWNVVLACGFHNNARGNLSIEECLKRGQHQGKDGQE